MQNVLNKFPCFIGNEINFCESYVECFVDETDLRNREIDNPYNIFKQGGLHFIHLNTNSILPKIDQLRQNKQGRSQGGGGRPPLPSKWKDKSCPFFLVK